MLFLFCLFTAQNPINGSIFKYIPEQSPQTIKLQGGQALMIAEGINPTISITIPKIYSSPRYVSSCHKFFSFVNNATVTMHFLSNISFFIVNNWEKLYKITNDCDFLLQDFDFHCDNDNIYRDFILLPNIVKKNKNIAKCSDIYSNYEKEIKDFSSQPPYSLKIKSSNLLISNATIEVDYGYGKKHISTYNETFQILPFKAKLYITYNSCDSFLFKDIEINYAQNYSLSLTMNDIPKSCFSYSASILVSMDFPSSAKLFYKLGNESITPISLVKGSYFHISRNFPFSLTFYVQYSRCIDFYLIKTASIDDYSKPRIINVFASDIPDICDE